MSAQSSFLPSSKKKYAGRLTVSVKRRPAFFWSTLAAVARTLQGAFAQAARRYWKHLAVADSTGQELTYGRTLIAAIALGRALEKRTAGQSVVGTYLPASAGAVLTNLAVLYAGRVPVNLNFTLGRETLDATIARAGLTTIVTSRRFLEKLGSTPLPSMIFLEDIRETIGTPARIAALLRARFGSLEALDVPTVVAGACETPLATIVFSSGSTGEPKGVMLTHANVLSNVRSFTRIFPMKPGDCFIGLLPLFHSFGFTCTMWYPLLHGAAVAYHPNPTDAKTIGELAEKYRGTMLISTPTFCQSYVRRCTPAQFATLKYAIVGAEKLREPLATEFRQRFGLDLLEGYGCTEMSPVVSVNRPGRKAGSVGFPVSGVKAKVVDLTTGLQLPAGEEGLLLVSGPNLMAGYLHDTARTAEAVRDGWYVTGDIARIDEEGFIFITDRLSRFSKIGGEMVPHGAVEDAINALLGEVASVVTAVPDPIKGERLVAFYTRADVSPTDLAHRLTETDLPRLWIPKRDSLVVIDSIPSLGTGKVDLREVQRLALERT
jgi:acyl-[acyl-carrier-protein]-phospholipid O-acyltransferase/long-chain-fatty-acid--[acyl-carrier-protein] ligase